MSSVEKVQYYDQIGLFGLVLLPYLFQDCIVKGRKSRWGLNSKLEFPLSSALEFANCVWPFVINAIYILLQDQGASYLCWTVNAGRR